MRAAAALVLLLTAAGALAGCAQHGDGVRLLRAGPDSGYRDAGPEPWVQVLADQGAWELFWREHRANLPGSGEPPEAPAVDFGRHAVLAVVAGEKPTGGYAVAADIDLEGPDRAARIEVTVSRPGRGCVPPQGITAPYALYEVPGDRLRLGASPVVTVREAVQDC